LLIPEKTAAQPAVERRFPACGGKNAAQKARLHEGLEEKWRASPLPGCAESAFVKSGGRGGAVCAGNGSRGTHQLCGNLFTNFDMMQE
jgi:hypothetical protein